MASYYYLIASLPALDKDKPCISYQRFLDMCRNFVSEKVYRSLSGLSLTGNGSSCGCRIADEFRQYCCGISELLAFRRREKMGKNQNLTSPAISSSECVQTVQKALEESNPLEAELILLDAQLSYVDGLCSLHFFDEYVLFGYAIRLKILERRSIFSHEKGKKEFSRLYTGIQNTINSI